MESQLTSEIVKYLSEQTFSYDIKFTREFDETDMTFPRVIVKQIVDTTAIRTANDEYAALIGFQFDIYTKDCTKKNGEVVNKVTASDEIYQELNQFIYDKYRFSRDDVYTNERHTIDVARKVIRYSGAIDRYNYIYRTL